MKRYAFFVGIDNYDDKNITNLQCARNDATMLYGDFRVAGFDEVVLIQETEAGSSALLWRLEEFCKSLRSGDLLVFYFAGHGRELNNEHFLVCKDGYADPKRYMVGSLPMSAIIDATGKNGVRRLFILDCCRSSLLAGRGTTGFVCEASRNIALAEVVEPQDGLFPPLILSSCSSGERAFEDHEHSHGYFTEALSETLNDKAVNSFESFRSRLRDKLRYILPDGLKQNICWNGDVDGWNEVNLFNWAVPQPAPQPAVDLPENYYEVQVKFDDSKNALKLNKIPLDGELKNQLKLANAAKKNSDFTAEKKYLEKFITIADDLIKEQKRLLSEKSPYLAEKKRLSFRKLREVGNSILAWCGKIRMPEIKFRKPGMKKIRFKLQIPPMPGRLKKFLRILFRPWVIISLIVVIAGYWAVSAYTGTPRYIAESAGVIFDEKDENIIVGVKKDKMLAVTEVVIPEGVTRIEQCAFAGCVNLKSVTVPDSVTTIRSGAFEGCRNLRKITIPDGVTTIGSRAFADCTGLEKISISNSVTAIGSNAFAGCTNLQFIKIPKGVSVIAVRTFYGCRNLSEVTVSSGVKEIGDDAFRNCAALKNIYIPDSVENIGEGAFLGTALSKAEIPKGCDYNYWKPGDDSFAFKPVERK